MSEQEIQANRFRLLSRLADDIAHEVKNPLHAMIINLEVLRKRVQAGSTDDALARAAVIEHEIHRVHEIVENLLRLLRPDSEGLQSLEVDQVAAELVPLIELQARLARVEFRYIPFEAGSAARFRRDSFKFAVLSITDPLIELLRARGGILLIRGESTPAELRLRVAAAPLSQRRSGGPTDAEPGMPRATDPFDAAHALAAELIRDARGTVLRGTPETDSDIEFLIAIPRLTGA